MKNVFVLLFALMMVFSACEKSDDSESESEFTNKIELGTGVNQTNPFILTGIGTTFSANATIYFRLESKDDMGGSTVKIQVNKSDGSSYASWNYPAAQSYGHIMVSSFRITDAGSYTVTGILVTGNKTVASINIVIN